MKEICDHIRQGSQICPIMRYGYPTCPRMAWYQAHAPAIEVSPEIMQQYEQQAAAYEDLSV